MTTETVEGACGVCAFLLLWAAGSVGLAFVLLVLAVLLAEGL